jgi:glycosyltransferase involved in cell wall biosynthesis
MHVCTVVEPRRLAWARALVEDVHRLHPGSSCTVLVVDDDPAATHDVPGAEVLVPADLPGLPLTRLALAYDATELAAALTPWLMRLLLDRGLEHVVHLDPQAVLLAPLEELPALCGASSVVLVARTGSPLPRDARRPHEQDVLLTGLYDRVLVGVGAGETGRAMLDWWAERTLTDAYDAPAIGQYLDQRWLDLVPGLFDHVVLTDPVWDVDALVLAHHRLGRAADGSVTLDERPVRLLNLRGHSVRVPHLLDAATAEPRRVLLSEQPVLRVLCDAQDARLRALDPDVDAETVPPYATFDGVLVDRVVRRLVRAELAREASSAPTRPGPWDRPLREWLDDVDPESTIHAVGRYLAEVYRSRPDLQAAFPELVKGRAKGFLGWVARRGAYELGPTVEALRTTQAPEGSTGSELLSRRPAARAGLRSDAAVEVVGYLTAELGQGESARQLVAGLELAGERVATSTYTRLSSRLGVPWTDRVPAPGTRPDTMLLCVSPEALPELVADLGAAALKDRYVVGLWFWELTDFPQRLHGSLRLVDEIWVASEFNAATLRAVTDKPVVVVPHPAHAPAYSATPMAEVPDDDVPTFLFVFDYLSILERKNPMRTVEAFVRAFPEPGSARLVIKSINGDKKQADRERLRYLVSGRDDIVLVERYLAREELDALMHRADAYVSLHRSEGFGQTLAEMMAIGKPVIATAYSGNLEFTRPDNSYLVAATTTPVPPGNAPYLPPSQWGEPDLDEAVAAMRAVVDDPAEAARRAGLARRTIEEEFTVAALADVLAGRLGELRAERKAAPGATPDEEPEPPAERRWLRRRTPRRRG